jgi:hypothetical protein
VLVGIKKAELRRVALMTTGEEQYEFTAVMVSEAQHSDMIPET